MSEHRLREAAQLAELVDHLPLASRLAFALEISSPVLEGYFSGSEGERVENWLRVLEAGAPMADLEVGARSLRLRAQERAEDGGHWYGADRLRVLAMLLEVASGGSVGELVDSCRQLVVADIMLEHMEEARNADSGRIPGLAQIAAERIRRALVAQVRAAAHVSR